VSGQPVPWHRTAHQRQPQQRHEVSGHDNDEESAEFVHAWQRSAAP
jgi:hypothetical protein